MPLLKDVATPQNFSESIESGIWWNALDRSVATRYHHWPICRREDLTSGHRDVWGLQYWPTSEKAVTRRVPPLDYLTKREGLTYSTVLSATSGFTRIPLDSRASNVPCNSTSLPYAYWGRRPLRCVCVCVCVGGGEGGLSKPNVFCCTEWTKGAIVTTNLQA